jgi:SAM-dependent methyltransferase
MHSAKGELPGASAPPARAMTSDFELFKNSWFNAINDNFMATIFEDLARRHKIANALDVGCGNGLFGADLKKKTSCHMTGVDGSKFALVQAKKAGYDEVRSCGDLCGKPLPFPDASFDFALCKDVLEHMLFPLALLYQIKRVLKPGGLLLSLVPNHFTLPARIRFLFSGDVDTYSFFPDANEWDYPHIRFYSHGGFRALHVAAGFSLKEDLGPHFAVRAPKLWRLPGYAAAIGFLYRQFPSSFATAHTAIFEARRTP